jgi:hypothetical protein
VPDGFAAMHLPKDVFDVDAVISKQIGECVVIGSLGAVIAHSLEVVVLTLQFF